MTRKTFILAGLFLIALGPLSVALQSYLLLSKIIPIEPYYLLFDALVIPIGFGLLLWKWLRTSGRSVRFTAFSFFGLLVTFYLWFIFLTLYLSFIFPITAWIGLDMSAIMSDEIGAWVSSGREDVIIFTVKAKLQVALILTIDYMFVNWPLFVALYLAASDPRFPKGKNLFGRLSKRIFATRRATSRTIEQTVS